MPETHVLKLNVWITEFINPVTLILWELLPCRFILSTRSIFNKSICTIRFKFYVFYRMCSPQWRNSPWRSDIYWPVLCSFLRKPPAHKVVRQRCPCCCWRRVHTVATRLPLTWCQTEPAGTVTRHGSVRDAGWTAQHIVQRGSWQFLIFAPSLCIAITFRNIH